jgi:signal peptidase II
MWIEQSDYTIVQNAGVAFGIHFPPVFQNTLIFCVFVFVLVMAYQSRANKIPSIGFGLIIGGAVANILDRLHDGTVTDFIDVGFWPVFNIADSCITVGVGVLLLWECKKSTKFQIPKESQI